MAREKGVNRIDLAPYRFEALIFDCDGTLVNTAPLHFRSLQRAFAFQGLEPERSYSAPTTSVGPVSDIPVVRPLGFWPRGRGWAVQKCGGVQNRSAV